MPCLMAMIALSLTAFSGAGTLGDLTYTIVGGTEVTITDLTNWTTTGVTLSAPDGDGCVTASIPSDGPRGFMRLEVVED